ncbi:MAG: ABC transporter ATP-binding protein [Caldilineaceae bacterium]
MSNAVLRVKNLDVEYHTDAGAVKANNNVTFELRPKERLGLVGESGSGKSTLALAILRMIRPPGRIAGGEVWLDGVDLTKISDEEMRRTRGNQISMVPQGAMNSLNPVMRIEDQIIDGMIDHNLGLSRNVMKEMAAEALRAVDLDPKVGRSYPHELSGGMKQRACIAISIVMTPKVIIADEPTSAGCGDAAAGHADHWQNSGPNGQRRYIDWPRHGADGPICGPHCRHVRRAHDGVGHGERHFHRRHAPLHPGAHRQFARAGQPRHF